MYVDPLGQSYQIVLRDKNTKQIVSGGLVGDERYIGQGYVWLGYITGQELTAPHMVRMIIQRCFSCIGGHTG